jgi:hypothetical protein
MCTGLAALQEWFLIGLQLLVLAVLLFVAAC